ncbi:Mov34/MPN/PAD-1 family protein [Oceanobacillus sp. FSL K6-3682]
MFNERVNTIKEDYLYYLPCGKTLLIKKNVLHKMNNYRQINRKDLEAGGILIGRILIENENYVIDDVTIPTQYDKRTRNRFKRNPKGHQEYYDDLFRETDGRCFYLGEWHTHPERLPRPSFIDKRNWKRINELKFETEDLFFIILGTTDLKVWSISKNEDKIILLDREDKNG